MSASLLNSLSIIALSVAVVINSVVLTKVARRLNERADR